MTEGVLAAIIGVAGTLLGTVLGWALSKINCGTLSISIVNDDFFYGKYNNMKVQKRLFQESDFYTMRIKFDAFNSNSKTKIMRNIRLVFKNKENDVLKSFTPKDADLEYNTDICAVNVFAKGVVTKSVYYDIPKNESWLNDLFKNTYKVFLEYSDEKDRTKSVLVKQGSLLYEDYE